MPEKVSETYRTKLGTYRGLECGMILHPLGGTEVYLDGAVRCREQLMRDNPGPRAVLNALERLADGYEHDMPPPEGRDRGEAGPVAGLRGPAGQAVRPRGIQRASWLTYATS